MAGGVAAGSDAPSINPAISRRQGDDGLGQGRREQQGAAVLRRGFQDELQILAEAHVEHFIAQSSTTPEAGDFQARSMIAAGRITDDIDAPPPLPPLGAVHTAGTSDDAHRHKSVAQLSSRCTCIASSRVGAMISARGSPAGPIVSAGNRWCRPAPDRKRWSCPASLGGNQQVAPFDFSAATASICLGVASASVALGQGAGQKRDGWWKVKDFSGGRQRALFYPYSPKKIEKAEFSSSPAPVTMFAVALSCISRSDGNRARLSCRASPVRSASILNSALARAPLPESQFSRLATGFQRHQSHHGSGIRLFAGFGRARGRHRSSLLSLASAQSGDFVAPLWRWR